MRVLSLLTTSLVLTSSATVTTADVSAAGAALGGLKALDYRFFVAGGTCAAFSHGITCPIDVCLICDWVFPHIIHKMILVITTIMSFC